MKRLFVALIVFAFMTGMVFAPIIPVAGPSCKPTSATNGMIGCWPQVNPSTVTSSDYFDIWQPGPFPASANLVSIYGLFAAPPPIGTSATPAIGWLQAIGISDLLGHTATVTLEFPTFAAFTAYKPSVITTALAWLGAPVVAHTTGYFTAGDGGSATYNWNRTSSATADNLFVITGGSGAGGRWFLQMPSGGTDIRALGVVVDGVTSADVALAAAATACTTYGTKLFIPPGGVALTGAGGVTSPLQNCSLVGVESPAAAAVNIVGGSTFLLTSTSIRPFQCGLAWSISGVNFYWPGQTTGVVSYPALISDSGASGPGCAHFSFYDNVIVNAYQGIVQSANTSWGDAKIYGNTMYAVKDLFYFSLLGDSSMVFGNRFSPGPWFSICGFGGGGIPNCEPAASAGASVSSILHVAAGGGVVINMDGQTFAWRYGILIDSGANVTESIFNLNWDTVGTILDSSSGGTYAAGNVMTGSSAGCNLLTSAGGHTGNPPCFNLGATGELDLTGFVGAGNGSLIVTDGSSVHMMDSIGGIGFLGDATDYSCILVTGVTVSTQIFMKNSQCNGAGAKATLHGVTTGSNVAADIAIQNNLFQLLNDDINIAPAPLTTITGNQSVLTFGSVSVSIASSSNAVQYGHNVWDKPPTALVSACGTGAVVHGAVSGYIAVGSTVNTLLCTLTLPWSPTGLGGGACTFTSGGAFQVGAGVTGTPPVWTIGSNADMHGSQIFFNCPGQQ